MKLTTKLALTYVAFILVTAIIGLVSINLTRTVKEKIDNMYSNALLPIVYLSNAANEAIYHNRTLYDYIIQTHKVDMDEDKTIMDRHEKKMKLQLDKYRKTDITDKEKILVTEFDSAWPEYLSAINQILPLSYEGKNDQAIALANGICFEKFQKIADILGELVDINENLGKQAKLESDLEYGKVRILVFGTMLVNLFLALCSYSFLSLSITRPLTKCVEVADRIATGELSLDLTDSANRSDEVGLLLQSLNKMILALNKNREQTKRQDWLKTGFARLNEVMIGDPDLGELAARVISETAAYLDAELGGLYVAMEENAGALTLMGSYGYVKKQNYPDMFSPGQGLLGQAVLDKKQIILKNVPGDYLKITSGLGEGLPRIIAITPLIHEDRVKGALELAAFSGLSDLQLDYLKAAAPVIARAIESAQRRMLLDASLARAQGLTEELQAQQEELRISTGENDE